MTSATTTPARGMGRRHPEGYGLIVFASVLLLVPGDHRGGRSRAMGPVCLWQPREPGCLAMPCVDRPQLAGIATSAVLASVAMVIRYRSRSALRAIDRVVVLTVPRRVQALATSARPGNGRRAIPVPLVRDPPLACGPGTCRKAEEDKSMTNEGYWCSEARHGAPDQQTARRNPGGTTNVRDHFRRSSRFRTGRRIRRLQCHHRPGHDDPSRRTARSGSPLGNRAADHRTRA